VREGIDIASFSDGMVVVRIQKVQGLVIHVRYEGGLYGAQELPDRRPNVRPIQKNHIKPLIGKVQRILEPPPVSFPGR
jgi:hypothetical protein